MRILSISLDHFRSYKKQKFSFSDNVTIIVGPNGSGKTNILEAVEVLSTGGSQRVGMTRELINIESAFARVVGRSESKDKLEVILEKREFLSRTVKTFKINGARKTSPKFVGVLKTVLFAPYHIRLVAGSPSRRRDYLDRVLSQVDSRYNRSVSEYKRVIRQRNKVLEGLHDFRHSDARKNQLEFWNRRMLDLGLYIHEVRSKFFDESKDYLPEISLNLYNKNRILKLNYRKSNLSERVLESLRDEEIKKRTSQAGPHRDDFEFILQSDKNTFELSGYGSRGEQRTGVLALKIYELKYFESESGEKPVLLLDDIFSELDDNYRKAVEHVINSQQTIITTADINSVPKRLLENARVIEL